MANVDHISHSGFSVVATIKNFFASVNESLVLSRQYQDTFNELDRLSNRDLDDMGIGRSDISRIAYDSVYGTSLSEFTKR